MRTTGLVSDPRFQRHDPGAGHPERPDRLRALDKLFELSPYRELSRIAARAATEEEIERVHTHDLMQAVSASAGRPLTRFDADTVACSDSFEAARLAAGATIELVEAVLNGRVDNGFAALRPPGHHAEHDRAMGFCLFNNVAVAARHLRAKRGLERVLIFDWDVHHGNGTQHSFYADSSVLYASLHQYPFYPGTGSVDEIGTGVGAGFTVNMPMQAGWGMDPYAAALRECFLPIARAFSPQFVLVSAGFDAHRDDPLASMQLDASAFAEMTNALVGLADECCEGRIILLLEGGYSLEALTSSVRTVLDRLAEPAQFAEDVGELTAWGHAARQALAPYWKT